jgi:hypothetical protein
MGIQFDKWLERRISVADQRATSSSWLTNSNIIKPKRDANVGTEDWPRHVRKHEITVMSKHKRLFQNEKSNARRGDEVQYMYGTIRVDEISSD